MILLAFMVWCMTFPVPTTSQPIILNKTSNSKISGFNDHLLFRPTVLQDQLNKSTALAGQPSQVFFKELPDIQLSRSTFRYITFIDMDSILESFSNLENKTANLLAEVNEKLQDPLVHDSIISEYVTMRKQGTPELSRKYKYDKVLQEKLAEIQALLDLIRQLKFSFLRALGINQNDRVKRKGVFTSVWDFFFGNNDIPDSVKRNLRILADNGKLRDDKLNQLTILHNLVHSDVKKNRFFLDQLKTELETINATLTEVTHHITLLEFDTSVIFLVIQINDRISLIRLGLTQLQTNVASVVGFINAVQSSKVTPSLIDPPQLIALLNIVRQQIKGFPSLDLPHANTEIFEYYKFLKISSSKYKKYFFLLIDFPLVDKSKTFTVYEIFNLPIYQPALDKLMKYTFEEKYIAISNDGLYVTVPDADEILSCTLSGNHFCQLSTALYQSDKVGFCSFALLRREESRIKGNCKVKYSDFDKDIAIQIQDQFWFVSTRTKSTLYVKCLAKNYYQKLKFPFDIIKLPNSCEATTDYLLIPARFNQETSTKTELKLKYINLNLQYNSTLDFQIAQVFNLNGKDKSTLNRTSERISPLKSYSINDMQQIYEEIDENYDSYEVPLWLKLLLTAFITFSVNSLMMIIILVKFKHFPCRVTKEKISTDSKLRNLEQELASMKPLLKRDDPKMKVMPATPRSVKKHLEKLGVDFTKFQEFQERQVKSCKEGAATQDP